jgi:hypothetical protein
MHGGSYVAAVVLTQLWVMLAWVFCCGSGFLDSAIS